MKVIIAGSRTIQSYVTVLDAIAASGWQDEITEVVCGMAMGVDLLGKHWGNSRGVTVKRFPADWDTHGKAAGPIRNEAMAEYADALILVWDGKSRGSASMLECAKRHGIKIHEYIVDAQPKGDT